MAQEHHIDNFDLESFFKYGLIACFFRTVHRTHLLYLSSRSLHDLDQDGYLTIPELEAVYGLHHPHAKKDTPDAHMEAKRKAIIDKVLKQLDKDGDGELSSLARAL